MNSDLRQQIYGKMNIKETNELLEIWQANDRFEWSDEAFDVIEEIFQERAVDIPKQGEPIYEHDEEESGEFDREFSEEELAIMDDENPPVFYDPFEVLLTTKWLNWMIKAMIGFIVLYNIIHLPSSRDIVRGFLVQSAANQTVELVISILMASLNAVIGIVLVYVPLKALTHILRILMEMEFQSRKVD